MKILTETLKQMLEALAFAHAGEYLTQREKGRVLDQKAGTIDEVQIISEPVPVETGTRSKARRVALYLGNELPDEVMDYLIQTCSRLRHELTVITFESPSTARALLDAHQQVLDAANVNMKLVTLSGEPIAGLRRYLRSHSEIAFLACKDSGYLGRSYLNGTQPKNALPVPVVVVATGTAIQQQPAADQNSKGAVVA